MTPKIFILILLLFFTSCDKRLKVVTVSNADIQVTKYEISEITTVHDFVEVVKENSAVTVLETNSYGFANIVISRDTIIIKYLPTFFYKIVDKAFNYTIKIDTSISVEYWRQNVEEREKQKN